MTRKRGHNGSGSIDPSGEGSWRLRYRIGGKRYAKVIKGTRTEAAKELRRLLHDADAGQHVAPDKMTVAAWANHWISIGAPGRRKKKNGGRTIERYAELLELHVKPNIGTKQMQKLAGPDIDNLYSGLEEKGLSGTTRRHIHVVLKSCLDAAGRGSIIAKNPVEKAQTVPTVDEFDYEPLDDKQLAAVVKGFRTSPALFPIVCVLAWTGCRRSEALALRVTDLDAEQKTLRIERALEKTKKNGLQFKGPKKEVHKRTIQIDQELVTVLLAQINKLKRLAAGIPDGSDIDLSLVKLPADALLFPSLPGPGRKFTFSKPRDPDNTTKEFKLKAIKLGFRDLRLHELRGSHETCLLDAGVPVHVVAKRCGHDPAVLLRVYAKRTRKADEAAADAIATLSKGVLAG